MNSTVAKLMDAVLAAWTKSLPPPYGSGDYSSAVDGATDCNRFANEVAEALGYPRLRGMTANDIATFLRKHAEDWMEVDGRAAQHHANTGALVFASWENPDPRLHGHVCLVIPGTTGVSGRWASEDVPRVANVSRPELCRIDLRANFAFSERPLYHALKSTMQENPS